MTPEGHPGPGVAGAGPARSVVIPMFRESDRIRSTIATLAGSVLDRADTEILLVDDGSNDGTGALAEEAVGAHGLVNARVVRHAVNQGKGGAVRSGILASRGSAVAFADADLAAGVGEIDRCLCVVEEGRADVVFTTRLHAESVITRLPPLSRRLAGKAFNLLLRALRMTRYADTQCGLKGFRREAALTLFRDLRVRRFAFDVEVLVRADRLGMEVVELPISWHHMDDSRVSTLPDGLRMVADALRLKRALRAGAVPELGSEPLASQMTPEQFDVMARVERDHWWWRAKRSVVARAIRSSAVEPGRAADVGCGTGETLGMLSAMGFKPVLGTDLSPAALSAAGARRDPTVTLLRSSAAALPVASGSLACLTSLDVIEHLDDDVAALREYGRAVEPGGLVVITVPAYRWAWSDHDVALGHRRRYTAPGLQASAATAGLEVVRCSYFHSWLVVPALLLRRTPLRRFVKQSAEEASYVGPTVNGWLGRLAAAEQWVARRRRIPFGLSILLTARAPGETTDRPA